MRLIFTYIKLYKYKVILAAALIFFLTLIQSFFLYVNKILIDDVFGNSHQYDILPKLIIGVICAAIIFFILNITKQLLISYISQKITLDIKNELTKKIRGLSFTSFSRKSVGEYLSIFQSDLPLITNIFGNILPSLVTIIQQLLITGTILVILNPSLLVLAIILIPINVGVNFLFLKPVNKYSLKTQQIISEVTEKTKESLTNTKEIIGFSRKEWDIKRLKQTNLRLIPVELKRELIGSFSSNSNFIIYWMVFIIIIYFGGKQVQNGDMTLGTLIAFITYLMGLFSPVSVLLNLNIELQRCIGGAKRVFELIDIPEKEAFNDSSKKDLFPVTFEKVTHSFDNGKNVLNNIDLEIRKGETVAIIGESGEGKSTIINILLGFHLPRSGKVTMNGTNLTEANSESFLDNIAVVFQENNLFSGTIKENIQFGNLSANEDDIVFAAKSAKAHDFIESLPLGYETVIGEKFTILSGGQKQRIAIARALVKKPQLLILDEATSALDYTTEKGINFKVEPDQATVIITHRLENLTGVDKIYTLKNGTVTKFSSYEEATGKMVLGTS